MAILGADGRASLQVEAVVPVIKVEPKARAANQMVPPTAAEVMAAVTPHASRVPLQASDIQIAISNLQTKLKLEKGTWTAEATTI